MLMSRKKRIASTLEENHRNWQCIGKITGETIHGIIGATEIRVLCAGISAVGDPDGYHKRGEKI